MLSDIIPEYCRPVVLLTATTLVPSGIADADVIVPLIDVFSSSIHSTETD